MSRHLLGLILLIVWTCGCSSSTTTSNSANTNKAASINEKRTTSSEKSSNESATRAERANDRRERDRMISLYIDARLNRQGLCDVNVSTELGEVVLTGRVESEMERALAERVASDAPDVTGVKNQIVIVSADPNLNKRAGPKGRPCT
jgi:osmotically-inducible protein OsmY